MGRIVMGTRESHFFIYYKKLEAFAKPATTYWVVCGFLNIGGKCDLSNPSRTSMPSRQRRRGTAWAI
jgi:hypothetical protein